MDSERRSAESPTIDDSFHRSISTEVLAETMMRAPSPSEELNTVLECPADNEAQQDTKASSDEAEDKSMNMPETMPPEPQVGNIEYKLKLLNPSNDRMIHLATQMKWRLSEGEGEAVYEIGVADNGDMTGLTLLELDASLLTLQKIAQSVGAHAKVLRRRNGSDGTGCVAEVHVRRVPDDLQFLDLRVAMLGNTDAGKSTLLGVLSSGELDTGRGKARLNLFRHRHEIQSGHTSSIGRQVIGFDSDGNVVNNKSCDLATTEEICLQSSKIITFIDLAGHEKYMHTTVFGLTSRPPDFAALVISAAVGVTGTCQEHFALADALQVPIFIIVTKIDICNRARLLKSLEEITSMVKSPQFSKLPVIANNMDDVCFIGPNFIDRKMVPIFLVSNVSGKNLNLIKAFLNLLPPQVRHNDHLALSPPDFMIEEVFNIPEVGQVVAGTLKQGTVYVGDRLLLGPNQCGAFTACIVSSIHRNRVPCTCLRAGQAASFSLTFDKKDEKQTDIRMGQCLTSEELRPAACIEFDVDLFVVAHHGRISVNFQALVHIGSVRQSVTVISIDPPEVATGQTARARLRFLKYPEYLRIGSSVLLVGSHGKCIGSVVEIQPLGTYSPKK